MLVRVQHSDRGAAAVEFAMVALLLITLMATVFEGGRLFYLQASLAAAARDGAREMAVKDDAGLAETRVDASFFPVGGPGNLSVSVTPGTGGCDSGGQAEVVATYVTGTMTGLIGPDSITLSGTGVMRCNG